MEFRSVVLMLPLLGACHELPWFECKQDRQCHDYNLNPGRCLPAPGACYCALPDKDCPTGWRWEESARDPFSNTCVDPSVPLDGGVDACADQIITGS